MYKASSNDWTCYSNKAMSSKVSDKKLLKKYIRIWKITRSLMNI